MRDIFYFDAAAELVLILLLFSIFVKKLHRNHSTKVFIAIIMCCGIACVAEIPTCFPDRIGKDLMWFCNTIYYLARNTMPIALIIYLISITETWDIIKKKKLLILALTIPYVIAMGFILTNYYSNAIFYIDNNGEYHRGMFVFVVYLIAFYYLIYSLIYLIICHKFFSKYQFVALFSVIPFTFTAVIIQFFNPGYYIELFVSTLSFIMICSAIETPEELLDQKTGLLSMKQFINMSWKSFKFHRSQPTVILKVKNYFELYSLLSYRNAHKYVKEMSTEFGRRYRNIDSKYKTYFLEEGIYAAVFSNYELALVVANKLKDDFELLSKRRVDFRININIFVTDISKDFSNITELNSFINNLHSKYSYSEKITEISKIKNEKRYIIENNIESILDEGLKNNEFEVYYQPIFNTKNNKFETAEALVRLNSEKYGFIGPDLFIPQAEKNGRITQIDTFVLEEVMQFISSPLFKALGLKAIEVNLSFVDCSDPTLHERIKKLLTKYNIKPESLNLEFTESYDANFDIVDINIKKLREMGINFSLDDYGTGYSNIDRFVKLPLQIVKIDKSLVDRYLDDDMAMVLKNTINMIKDLNRKIVVEGTETSNQVEAFINYGCDYIQGFYYSKPLEKDEFINFIKEKNNVELIQ